MNFEKDYYNFIKHIEDENRNGSSGPIILSHEERAAVKLFVAYLNILYQEENDNKSLNLTKTDG